MRDTNLANALREHADWWENGDMMNPLGGLEKDLFAAADRLENQNAHIAALQQEIEKLRGQAPRWIPVEERLPETQGWYHVAIRDEKTKRIAVELDLYSVETAKNFGHETGFCKDGRWDGREKVIAWMPLPQPTGLKRRRKRLTHCGTNCA
jgi:hypothetical protein